MASKSVKLLAFVMFMVWAAVGPTKSQKKNTCKGEFVDMVRQNYKENINCLVEEHIELELYSSLFYQAYASYFQRADVNLPGIKKFFTVYSMDNRGHAEHLISYVNNRGGHVRFDEINIRKMCKTVRSWQLKTNKAQLYKHGGGMCICDFVAEAVNRKCSRNSGWKEGLMAFTDALVVERYVQAQLHKLWNASDIATDAELAHTLEHYLLEDQVWAIYELGQHLTTFRRFDSGNASNYKLGEYVFDQHLQTDLTLPTAEILGGLTRDMWAYSLATGGSY